MKNNIKELKVENIWQLYIIYEIIKILRGIIILRIVKKADVYRHAQYSRIIAFLF